MRYKDLQWVGSHPNNFIKKNSLIYYTNGSMDLKKYIRESADKGPLINDVFNKDYTELKESDRVMAI